MYVFITILTLVVCVLLMFIILIQNPKGGGLSATFGGASNQLLGFQKVTDLVEKWTWGLAILLLVLSLATKAFVGGVSAEQVNNAFTPEAQKPAGNFTQPQLQPIQEDQATPGIVPEGDDQ
jgi:preprotein translocase subunit SecG